MTKDEFRKIRLLDKYGLVETEGNLLAERRYKSFRVRLYSLNDFYVEVWNKVGLNIIYWIEVVDQKNFEFYTDLIDITDLDK